MSDPKKQRPFLELQFQVSDDGKKKAKSRQSKPHQGTGGTQSKKSNKPEVCPRQLSRFVMHGSQVIPNETILRDKLNFCVQDSQKQKSYQKLAADLILSGSDSSPFWTEFAQVISSALSLPTQTDSLDLDLNWLNGYANVTSANSWFSMTASSVPSKNSFKICCPSSTASVRGFMGCEDTKKKSAKKYGKNPYKRSQKVQPNSVFKVPVWPTPELHKIWKQWLAAYRWVYNQCVEFFNQQQVLPKEKSLDQVIQSRQSFPENEWTKCLGKTRQEAVCEAELAYKQAKAANNTQSFQLRYRSCRNKSQVIQFKNDAYRDGTWFPKKVKGHLFCTAIGYQIPRNCDYGTELVYQRGHWFACFPQYIEPKTTDSHRVIALDPGNRAFLTGYDGENVLEIGKGDIGRINRLCSHLDNLLSRVALSKNKRQRYLMRKAASQMRTRIQHLVKDLHGKVASVLVNSYKLIFLPTYETSQMVLKSSRKISRKSVRNMLSWSHGKFASHIEQMAARSCVLVVRCNESYTSKTCTNCGHVHNNLGGSKIYKCPQCGQRIARDINGARNIMLRALQATAFTVINDSIVISDAISTEAL